MQFTLAAAALVATAAASSLAKREYSFNATCDLSAPYAKVVNRCPYPVYLWSIDKQDGCPPESGLVLGTGEHYNENYRTGSEGGVSIKLSKGTSCDAKVLTQLEYKIDSDPTYGGNYLDMSFVNCIDNIEDCPGRTDGFYLKSGNEKGLFLSEVNNEHCPIFSVANAVEAAAVSYINWDDRQTKYCNAQANLLLALCGGEEYDGSYVAAPPAPPSSSSEEAPSSSSEPPAPTTTEEPVVAAAAITEPPKAPAIKTEVVYVTEFVKRHAHAHNRRHQHFHA